MIYIFIGAGIGAILGAASVIILAKATGKPIRWKSVVANALGGAVGGAITAATLGAGTVASVGVTRTVAGFAAGGFGGGVVLQTSDNAMEGRPLTEGVLETAVDCTVTSVVAGGVGKAITPLARAGGARIAATSWGRVFNKVTGKFDEGVLLIADNVDNAKDATELDERKSEEDEARATAAANARAAAEARAAADQARADETHSAADQARADESRAAADRARAGETRADRARAGADQARAGETRADQARADEARATTDQARTDQARADQARATTDQARRAAANQAQALGTEQAPGTEQRAPQRGMLHLIPGK